MIKLTKKIKLTKRGSTFSIDKNKNVFLNSFLDNYLKEIKNDQTFKQDCKTMEIKLNKIGVEINSHFISLTL
ncbi:hypothetical protein DID75_01120 [Candidatus Marinamargulisbacteria bacterium SCGC AG-410-N11]|nr:hypothetical protein DID75_01120 [Candidatus Marinamargulisbacteria bacterium SCGC AG-410-N11]